MTPQREEALRLLRLALRDRETAELLLPLPQAHIAAIGFHVQQCAEKALKAVAALHGVEFRRSHDLVALADPLRVQGLDLPLGDEELRRLNPFAVEVRYDDELLPAVPRAELATTMALLLDWAVSCLGNEGEDS